jgi:hypothetical protein
MPLRGGTCRVNSQQPTRAHFAGSSAPLVHPRTWVSAERSPVQAGVRRSCPLELPPPRRGASRIFLLLLSLVAAACGSGEPHPQPEGSASPPAGAASERSSSVVAVAPARAPGGDTLGTDPAASNASAGETSTVAPNELRGGSMANPAPPPAPDASGCNPDAAGDAFEQSCLVCAGSDACASCLCSACTDEVQRCLQTAGCMEILACGRASGCSGMACYCGGADAVSCLNGNGEGACRSVIESAPGGRAPSLREPSAGPAAERAGAVAQCMQRDEACQSACGAP